METKAFRIIGISSDETESLGLSLSHRRQVGGLSVFCCLFSGLAPPVCDMYPPYFRRVLKVCQQPPSGKLPKSRITAHLHSFIPLFLPTFRINSHTLFNPIFPSRSSKQLFTTTSYLPPSKTTTFSTPVNPPQTHLFQIPCFPS